MDKSRCTSLGLNPLGGFFLHAQNFTEKILWCIVHTRGPPPCPLPSGVSSYPFAYPPPSFSLAVLCLGMPWLILLWSHISYGKYTLTPTNLCYPFVYIGLSLGIALAMPWHTAHALPMLYYNTLSPPKCLTHYNTRAHYTFVYHYLSFLAIVFLFCWCHVWFIGNDNSQTAWRRSPSKLARIFPAATVKGPSKKWLTKCLSICQG